MCSTGRHRKIHMYVYLPWDWNGNGNARARKEQLQKPQMLSASWTSGRRLNFRLKFKAKRQKTHAKRQSLSGGIGYQCQCRQNQNKGRRYKGRCPYPCKGNMQMPPTRAPRKSQIDRPSGRNEALCYLFVRRYVCGKSVV